MSDSDIAAATHDLDGWRHIDGELRRTIEAPSFPAAIALVQQVAQAAEHLNHHPDIDIRWRKVTFACTSHSEGGVTELDVQLAGEIDQLAAPR